MRSGEIWYVMAGPSAEMMVPAMEKAEGSGVKVWSAVVNAFCS